MMYAIAALLVMDILLTRVMLDKINGLQNRLDTLEGPSDPIPDGED